MARLTRLQSYSNWRVFSSAPKAIFRPRVKGLNIATIAVTVATNALCLTICLTAAPAAAGNPTDCSALLTDSILKELAEGYLEIETLEEKGDGIAAHALREALDGTVAEIRGTQPPAEFSKVLEESIAEIRNKRAARASHESTMATKRAEEELDVLPTFRFKREFLTTEGWQSHRSNLQFGDSTLLVQNSTGYSLYNLQNGEKIETQRLVFSEMQHPQVFSKDRTLMAFPLAENLLIWDLLSHKPFAQIEIPSEAPLIACAFSPDSRTVAMLTNRGELYLWDTKTNAVRALPSSRSGREYEIDLEITNGVLDFHPSGKTLAVALPDQITVVDTVKAQIRHELPITSPARDFRHSPDGSKFAIASQDGLLILNSSNHYSTIDTFKASVDGAVKVYFSPDSKFMTSHWHGTSPEMIVYSFSENKNLFRSDARNFGLQVVFSANSKRVLIPFGDSVQVWNPFTMTKEFSIPVAADHGLAPVHLSQDGKRLVLRQHNGRILVWEDQPW